MQELILILAWIFLAMIFLKTCCYFRSWQFLVLNQIGKIWGSKLSSVYQLLRMHNLSNTTNYTNVMINVMINGLNRTYPLNILTIVSGINDKLALLWRSMAIVRIAFDGPLPIDIVGDGIGIEVSSSGIKVLAIKSINPCTSPAISNRSYTNTSCSVLGRDSVSPNCGGFCWRISCSRLMHSSIATYCSKQGRLENLLQWTIENKQRIWDVN